ncbi:hypothetical protein [Devosia submarina]|uniref:hypothetical protein n=1 Tax=Devosia submarina TaxID=1173082 RepID=UPI000D3D921C|nr:hypothetical protein [Devosia submarina]
MILAFGFAFLSVALLGIAALGVFTGTVLNLDRSGPLWVSLSAAPEAFAWALGLCLVLGQASAMFSLLLFHWFRRTSR